MLECPRQVRQLLAIQLRHSRMQQRWRLNCRVELRLQRGLPFLQRIPLDSEVRAREAVLDRLELDSRCVPSSTIGSRRSMPASSISFQGFRMGWPTRSCSVHLIRSLTVLRNNKNRYTRIAIDSESVDQL
jgi:hypothetical protein